MIEFLKMIKTVKCKLLVGDHQTLALAETMVQFATACTEVAIYAARQNIWHTFRLQALYYHYIRAIYGLSANYAVRVCDRVARSKGKVFKPTSVTIDKELFRYIEKTEEATASTVRGRIRFKLAIGDYQRQLLKGWKFGAGTISYDRRTNQFFANLCVETPDVPAGGSKPLGVDLGINPNCHNLYRARHFWA